MGRFSSMDISYNCEYQYLTKLIEPVRLRFFNKSTSYFAPALELPPINKGNNLAINFIILYKFGHHAALI